MPSLKKRHLPPWALMTLFGTSYIDIALARRERDLAEFLNANG